MIKSRNELENKKIEIDLNGPEGNAFNLIGLAGSLGKQLNMSKFRIKCIQDEMTLSSYEMLVQTFDKWFGNYVILYR
jgi:hypothetical protein|tara:strand:+ start:207 stop:437 length:231 start_codon:yes stop_codon:yes gene_type:complete